MNYISVTWRVYQDHIA